MSRTERHPPIPGARTDITDEWMSQALGVDVAIVEEQRVGTGQVGMCVRYRLEGSEDAPARVVAKLPSDDDVSRATGMAMRNYEREVRFYKEIAPTVGIRTPRCYHADWDARLRAVRARCSKTSRPRNRETRSTDARVEQAALALDELAKLHAPRWADPTARGHGVAPRPGRRRRGGAHVPLPNAVAGLPRRVLRCHDRRARSRSGSGSARRSRPGSPVTTRRAR